MTGRVFVLGAAADQGLPLLAALEQSGFAPTAGVRRADALAVTAFAHVPAALCDIADENSLASAMAGHDALALHLPFTFDRAEAAQMGGAVAGAAARAGLDKIIFNTSCFVADHDLGLSAHDGRRDIERAIAETGIDYVFVEPMVFMDNLLRPWCRPSIARGVFAYPAGEDLAISWVCLDDIARVMVAALADASLTAAKLPLGGPEALTGGEVAARLGAVTGRPVEFRSLPPDRFAADMSELVTGSREVQPHGIYDGMAAMYRWYNAQLRSPLVVEATALPLDVTLTPFHDWAARQDWRGD